MKIAFIVPSLINKGPIIVVDTLVRNLINQVEKVDLFYFDKKYGIDFCCQTYRIDFDTPISFDNYDMSGFIISDMSPHYLFRYTIKINYTNSNC